MSKSTELHALRQQLLQIDAKILEYSIEREAILEKLKIVKMGLGPVYLPDIEHKKKKELIAFCKKKIQNLFHTSCLQQLNKNSKNCLFTVDKDCFFYSYLKDFVTFNSRRAKYIFTSRKDKKFQQIPIYIRTCPPKRVLPDRITLVMKKKDTLFRQRLTIYGSNNLIITDLKIFLESIANHVTIRS